MLQLMQSMMAQLSSAPQPPPAQVRTSPQAAVAARQPGTTPQNPWAPQPPPQLSIEAAGSVRPPASPRPLSVVPAFQLPQERPKCAVDRWVAAQNRQSENASEVDGGRNQLFQDGAAGGAPLSYAGSVASTMHSCQDQPLHKALKILQKAISKMPEENAETQGGAADSL